MPLGSGAQHTRLGPPLLGMQRALIVNKALAIPLYSRSKLFV